MNAPDPRFLYHEWNRALIEELFPRGRSGTPVFLAVHDALLESCGARIGRKGRSDFLRAVVQAAPTPGALFDVLKRMTDLWKSPVKEGYPPFVAGLAVAVLAACDMDTDEMATKANYYYRLGKLLGTETKEPPRNFEITIELWELLRRWLRDERRGELIVRGIGGSRQYVDAVKSQCFVRSCDLPELRVVYDAAYTSVEGPIEPEDVVPTLRAWLKGSGARSRLAALLGREPEPDALAAAAEALCNAIEAEPTACSSTAPNFVSSERPSSASESSSTDVTGTASLTVWPSPYPPLMWTRAKWYIRLAARDDDPESVSTLIQIGNREIEVLLDVREPPSFDGQLDLGDGVSVLLGRSNVKRDDGVDVTPKCRLPAWFRDGAARGRPGSWAMISVPRAGESYVVVVPATMGTTALQEFLDGPIVREILGTRELWPGPGLVAAIGVMPRAGAQLPGGLLVRARETTLRVEGGLPIRRRLYVRGGLPSLILAESEFVEVQECECVTPPQTVRARDFPALALVEGRYRISSGDARSELSVLEPRWQDCRPPFEASFDAEVRRAIEGGEVRGAEVRVSSPVYVCHFIPGTKFRVLAKHVEKGLAPFDSGIHEHRTQEPVCEVTVVGGRSGAKPDPRSASLNGQALDSSDPCDMSQEAFISQLIEYMSIRGAGGIDLVRPLCRRIVGDTRLPWHSVLSALEDLGHVDISWDAQRWTIAPAVANPFAHTQSLCYFAGARTADMLAWLRTSGVMAEVDRRATEASRIPMPPLIVAPTDQVEALLSGRGVQLLARPSALELAPQLRSVAEASWWTGPQFTPSLQVQPTLEAWDPSTLCWLRTASAAQSGLRLASGQLYRWNESGRWLHLLLRAGVPNFVVDPAACKWYLAPRGTSFLLYDRSRMRLCIPSAIGLPRAHRRACVLASGLTPKRLGRTLVYEGIPLKLARMLATRLNQQKAEGLW